MSILRTMFGPSRTEIWKQLSSEIGGSYIENGWRRDRVEATHGEWTVVLDTYAVSTGKTTVVFTRMRAPFVNPGRFRFVLYRTTMFTALGKLLGMQDIELGYPEFDDAFVLKSDDESRVRQLFADARLRELVAAQPSIRLEVKDDEGFFGKKFPDGVDELNFHVPGVIKDIERLKALYDLFAETLDQLCRIGTATPSEPGVKL